MSTLDCPETSTRPNVGQTSEIRNGVITITTTNADGSQTVRRVPAEQTKPSK